MSFLDIIDPRKKNYTDLVAIINRTKGSLSNTLRFNTRQQLGEYRAWVFSCASLISDRVSTVPFKFYNKITGEEVTTKNRGYKIFSKPIINPNPLMSFRFVKAFCQLQLDLCGMTCLYKVYNGLGQVWELWPLNMNHFMSLDVDYKTPINPVVKYNFNIEGKMYSFSKEELVVIHYQNPVCMFSGMSPIQAQAYAVDIEKYIEIYERDFFKNSARIDMALVTDASLKEDKAEFIKNRWLSKFNGNFHDIAVLDSGLKPVPLKFTNKDFEFLNLANWSKEKVLGAYRVPMSKLGSDAANRSGAVQADISFNRDSIQPRLTLWDEEISKQVLESFDDRLEIWHDNPIPRDRELEVKEARTYLGGLPTYTINEYKKIRGEKPIVGGDTMLIPKGWIRLEDIGKELNNDSPDGNNDTDPNRHDDDTPHLDPDGSDSRDDNPTDGRSISINNIDPTSLLRSEWNETIKGVLLKFEDIPSSAEVHKFCMDLMAKTIEILTNGELLVDKKDWIETVANKMATELIATLSGYNVKSLSWGSYVSQQFKCNSRIAKLINTTIRATMNYIKYLTFSNNNEKIHWSVVSNECGHLGRIKKAVSNGEPFELGDKKIRFPNEILNFSCDCTITVEKE